MAEDEYKPPLGVSLLFTSQATIDAASPEEREAYYRIAGNICDHPETFGLTAKPDLKQLAEDDRVDQAIHHANGEFK